MGHVAVNIMNIFFWNGLATGLFLFVLMLAWSLNRELIVGVFKKYAFIPVALIFFAFSLLGEYILDVAFDVTGVYYMAAIGVLAAVFVNPKTYLTYILFMTLISYSDKSNYQLISDVIFSFILAGFVYSTKSGGYKLIVQYIIVIIMQATFTTFMFLSTWRPHLGYEIAITTVTVTALFLIVMMVAYVFAYQFEKIYHHATQLRTLVAYDKSNVVRAALSSEKISKFIKENNVHYGIFAVLSFDGSDKIKLEYGSAVLDAAINKIISNLNDILSTHGIIFFKANEDRYGLLLKWDKQIQNLKTSVRGNGLEHRNDDDIVKVIELAIKSIPTNLAIDDKWVQLKARAGCALYGIHTHSIEQIINYAEFALESKNKFVDVNIAQLFDYSKYKQNRDDTLITKQIKKIVNTSNLYAMYRPVMDIKNGETPMYKCSFEIASVDYYGLAELFMEAEKTDTAKHLTRLLGQIGVSSFEEDDKYQLILPYDARILNESFEPYEFLNRLNKFGILPKMVILQFDSRNGYYDDSKSKENIDILRSSGLKIMINNVDDLKAKTFNTIDFIQPDYVGLSKYTVANIAKESECADIGELICEFCHDRNIEVICDGVTSKYQLEKLIDVDVDFITGPIMGSPLPIVAKPPVEVERHISLYHEKMILKGTD